MKIGNTQYNMARWGKDRYKKMMEIGFTAMDFSNEITDVHASCKVDNDEFLILVKEEQPKNA